MPLVTFFCASTATDFKMYKSSLFQNKDILHYVFGMCELVWGGSLHVQKEIT